MSKQRRLCLLVAVAVGMAGIATVRSRTQSGTPAVAEAAVQGVSSSARAVFASIPADDTAGRAPEVYQGSYFYRTAGTMLADLNVRVYPEDRVEAFPDPALGIGSTVRIYRAQPVLIREGTHDRLVRTWATTVAELATEQQLDLGDKDVVVPSRETRISTNGDLVTVTVTRVAESTVRSSTPIAFTTRYVNDPDLERGIERTEQVGHEGKLQKTYLVRRENGVEVSRTLMNQERILEPVEQVVRRGTKVVTYGDGKASWYQGKGSMTAAHPTLPFGTRVKVVSIASGRTVTVTIADRGPYIGGRVIDLSADAFRELAPLGAGVIAVRLEKAY